MQPEPAGIFQTVHDLSTRFSFSAAPTHFHPHVMGDAKFVDGSLVANCPLIVLFRVSAASARMKYLLLCNNFQEYDKCRQLGDQLELGCVISVGTGEPSETARTYETGTSLRHRSRHIRDMATLLIEQVQYGQQDIHSHLLSDPVDIRI